MQKNNPIENYKLQLITFSILILILIKLINSVNYFAIIINTILEYTILILIYFIYKKINIKIQINKKNITFKKILNPIYYTIFIFNFFFFLLTSLYFNDLLIMKYSLLNFNIEIIKYTLENIFPLKYYILLILLTTMLFLIPKTKIISLITPNQKKTFLILPIILIITIIFYNTNYNLTTNIYTNTIHDLISSTNKETIELDLGKINETKYNSTYFDKSIKNYNNINLKQNQKILIFVMEQTSQKIFQEELEKIPKEENFFEITKNISHYYNNHYTNNQDSRTTIWTLLNSKFLPFEAYIDNWNEKYGFILEENNLVELFNHKNYNTVVAMSANSPSLILGAYNWNKNIYLKEFDKNNKEYICIHEFEFQKGCEDKIILEDIKQELKENKNNNLFFFQEFIFGHGETYMQESQKSRTRYYNDYLLELYQYMQKENLLENTTIIVLADHGEKGYFQKELHNYNLPLIIINNKFEKEIEKEITFQIDFKDILLSNIAKNYSKKNYSKNENYIIGQTQSSEIGYLNSNKQYFLGNLNEEKFQLYKYENMKINKIQELTLKLKAYQQEIEIKSLKEHFWCKYCSQNFIESN